MILGVVSVVVVVVVTVIDFIGKVIDGDESVVI